MLDSGQLAPLHDTWRHSPNWKYITYWTVLTQGLSCSHRKFHETWTCQRDRQTDRHADRNTLPTYQRQSNQPFTYLLTNLHITSLIHQYIQKHLRVDNSLDQKYLVLTSCPLPPIDSIWALVFVWRLEGKIIRTALCCVVYNSCTQWYTHTHTWAVLTFLHLVRFRFLFVCLFRFCLLSVLALVAFVVLCLVSSVLSQVLAGKNVSEMTYFVNSINLTSCWEMP